MKRLKPLINALSTKGYDEVYLNKTIKLMTELGLRFTRMHLSRFEENGKYGYKNDYGQVVLPPKWYWTSGFSEGLAAVMDESTQMGYINMKGDVVIPLQWKMADFFSKGVAIVMDYNDHRHLIDYEGNVIIKFQKGKELYIDSNSSVWIIEEIGNEYNFIKMDSYVEKHVDRKKYNSYINDYIPDSINNTEIKFERKVLNRIYQMEKYGYEKESLIELLKLVVKHGYYVRP